MTLNNDNNTVLVPQDEEENVKAMEFRKYLYEKVVKLIPVLESAKPFDDYSIGKQGEGASIHVRGFNPDPGKSIIIDLQRDIPPVIEYNEEGKRVIKELGINNAPTIFFVFNKVAKEVQATSVRDYRSNYAKTLTTLDQQGNLVKTGAEAELNQKLDGYIDEFIENGYTLL